METKPEQYNSLKNTGKSFLSHIQDQVLVWRVQTFQNFSRKISVSPVRSKRYVFKVSGENGEYKRVYINVWASWEDEVCVSKRGHIQSLHEFLDWLKDASARQRISNSDHNPPPTVKALYKLQSDWWSANGKHFSIMLLPGEIRNLIYKYTFGQGAVLPLYTRTKGRGRRARDYMKAHLAPDIALMYTNRQIHSEAGAILYNDINFVIAKPSFLAPMLKHPCVRHIRKITLDLDHSDYLELLGMRQSDQQAVLHAFDDYPHFPSNEFLALAKLNLNKLILNFKDTADEPRILMLRRARHNLLMRYILSSALPHLKGHAVECWGAADDELVKDFRIEVAVARREFLDFEDWNLDQTIKAFQRFWGGDGVQPSKFREVETKRVEEELEAKRADGSLVVISDEAYPGNGMAW